MSIRIMSVVWEDGPKDKSETMVLLAIADFCNDDGECWPAVASIAKKARMTERGVQKICQRLCEIGWLEIDAGGGRKNCNLYRIKNPEHGSPRTRFTPNTVPETPNTVPKNPEPRSPEPSRTVKNRQSRARDALLSILSEKTADDFIEHRRSMRKPLTERAAELIVAKLAECKKPDDVVNLSIMNGWQGVFPERDGKNGGSAKASASDGDKKRSRWEYIAKHGTSEGWAA